MNGKVWLLVGVFLVAVSAVSSVIINYLNINRDSLRLNIDKMAIADYTLYAVQVITARGNYKLVNNIVHACLAFPLYSALNYYCVQVAI
jgi:hypothetical protein